MENKHKTNQEKAAYIALQSVYWLATEDTSSLAKGYDSGPPSLHPWRI